jgi:hypothetical protein
MSAKVHKQDKTIRENEGKIMYWRMKDDVLENER